MILTVPEHTYLVQGTPFQVSVTMEYIQTRPSVSPSFIDDEVMKKTVKVVCRQYATNSDVLGMLMSIAVGPDDVLGLYRGPPTDSGVYVTLVTDEALERIRSAPALLFNQKHFSVTQLGKQVVTIRVHWLPLFFSDNLIKHVLADFGHVIAVERCTTIHDRINIKNGMRVVSLEVDETQRLRMPHLIKFGCGTSMLLTIPGRPPLCLKCSQVGHLRRDCVSVPSYSNAVRRPYRYEEPAAKPIEPVEKVTQTTIDDQEEKEVGEVLVGDDIVEKEQEAGEQENMETIEAAASGNKRKDNPDDDSFPEAFPPQKLSKTYSIETPNQFSILDIDSSPLIIDDQQAYMFCFFSDYYPELYNGL